MLYYSGSIIEKLKKTTKLSVKVAYLCLYIRGRSTDQA